MTKRVKAIAIGKAGKKAGRVARHVTVALEADGVSGRYSFPVLDPTPERVAEVVAEYEDWHAKKAARVNAFPSGVINHVFSVGGRAFRISSVVIRRRGTDTELSIEVFTPEGILAAGFPLVRVYGGIDAVPDDAGVIELCREHVATVVQSEDEDARFVKDVKARLVGRG